MLPVKLSLFYEYSGKKIIKTLKHNFSPSADFHALIFICFQNIMFYFQLAFSTHFTNLSEDDNTKSDALKLPFVNEVKSNCGIRVKLLSCTFSATTMVGLHTEDKRSSPKTLKRMQTLRHQPQVRSIGNYLSIKIFVILWRQIS